MRENQKGTQQLIILLIVNLSLQFSQAIEDFAYKYYSYTDLINNISATAQDFPSLIKLHYAENEMSQPFSVKCNNAVEECKFPYIKMTDYTQPQEIIQRLPQLMLIGSIHGDEQIGTQAIMYLIKFVTENFLINAEIKFLLQNRMLILLPVDNPSGYSHIRREETNQYGSYDANRDFNYNVDPGQCYKTMAARVVSHIYRQSLIQLAITFHGGTNSLSYPWGGYNHIKQNQLSQEAPDDIGLVNVANHIVDIADGNINLGVTKYPTGSLTDTVYAVNGGMEDWGYAASWESDAMQKQCSYKVADQSEFAYNNASVRSMLFLVEADYEKMPAQNKLGNELGLKSVYVNQKTNQYYGHVNRNIILSLSLMEIASPYIKNISINSITAWENKKQTIMVTWQVGGCFTIDSTEVQWRVHAGNISNNKDQSPYNNNSSTYKNKTNPTSQSILGNPNDQFIFHANIYLEDQNLSENSFIDIIINTQCDSNLKQQQQPIPNIHPQTHFVNARTNDAYHMDNNGYIIQGSHILRSYLNGISLNDIQLAQYDFICQVISDINQFNIFNFKVLSTNDNTLTLQFQQFNNISGAFSLELYDKGSMIAQYSSVELNHTQAQNLIINIKTNAKFILNPGLQLVYKNQTQNFPLMGNILVNHSAFMCKQFGKGCFGRAIQFEEQLHCQIKNIRFNSNMTNMFSLYFNVNNSSDNQDAIISSLFGYIDNFVIEKHDSEVQQITLSIGDAQEEVIIYDSTQPEQQMYFSNQTNTNISLFFIDNKVTLRLLESRQNLVGSVVVLKINGIVLDTCQIAQNIEHYQSQQFSEIQKTRSLYTVIRQLFESQNDKNQSQTQIEIINIGSKLSVSIQIVFWVIVTIILSAIIFIVYRYIKRKRALKQGFELCSSPKSGGKIKGHEYLQQLQNNYVISQYNQFQSNYTENEQI